MSRYVLRWGFILCLLVGSLGLAIAQDNKDGFPTPTLVVVPGTIQSKLGCPGDWQPNCENTALTFDEAQGLWTGTFDLPAGRYEYKVALDGSWDRNYGANGQAGGPNIPLVLEADSSVTFTYDHATGIITDSASGSAPADAQAAAPRDIPQSVTIPGNLNPAMGCPAEWQPDCQAAMLEYDEAADVWSRTFTLPAGTYEYKVAINGSWAENYGGKADRDGPNIVLNVPADGDVTFFYDHKTKWVTDDIRNPIVTAPGSYQTALGCPANDDPACMASWLQDPDGDGIFTFSTTSIPAGDYSARFAIGRTADNMGEPMDFTVEADGDNVSFTYDAELNLMVVSTGGAAVSSADLRNQGAYWVTADTILWSAAPAEGVEYKLLYSSTGSIKVDLFGLSGDYETIDLTTGGSVPESAAAKFPHLAQLNAYTLTSTEAVADALRGQVAIGGFSGDDLVAVSGLQIAGVLDELYTTDAPLGITWDGDVPTISVWAPTAQNVEFLLYADSAPRTRPETLPMTRDDATGVWSITGDASWKNQYYQYSVTVFAPSVMEVVVNEVTDPYSVSLSINSVRSHIVDLNDPALKPEGWDDLVKPGIAQPEDISVYELHIRDFSALDESIPAEERGTYLAFTHLEGSGMQHLAKLADAGLTHLHLLPSFDIATINENRRRWFDVDYEALASLPPDSEEQQAAVNAVRDLDGFNWGYDPYHFMAPEGSYSTTPDGSARILEYRQMVQALAGLGLYTVQDVVFNHTNASGQATRSVLDRIVPGYYHRLNSSGMVERSTCCDNTATEHNMMRRLMIDTVVLMAIQYKIDGFRFDLMGHHMLADMIAVREALDALTLEEHGVDGSRIYIYGEGWNFGEVANNARGVNATQLNIGGTGIGVFNDRLRDAVRGGSPFGDREKQGLANGIFSNPNGLSPDNESLDRALLFADQTRVGLAGNLRDYTFVDRTGATVTGADVDYNGSPAGYTLDPQENIIYVDKHDNESLYDNNIYKAPVGTSMADRVRMQILGNAFVLYAQGIPFVQAGTELLRSKSLDRNSYNSGDWFNRLDFTYQTNNFGVGLPIAGDNSAEWPRMRPFLADPANVPASDDIIATMARWQDMLRVRYSSPLFRLPDAASVQEKLVFLNVGPQQQPGVIVMLLDDTAGAPVDDTYSQIVVIFNTTDETITFSDPALTAAYALHPALASGSDDVMKEAAFADGTFSVPALTAAVFVAP
jgi:pullulanase-type alpha-1,6-glucosidase